MEKQPSTTMSSVPEEICIEIFLRLPARSIIACKYACKTWFTLISDPAFVKLHINRKNNPKFIVKNYYGKPKRHYVCKSVSYDSLTSEDDVDGAYWMDCYPFKFLVEGDNKDFNVRFVASSNGLVVCLFCYIHFYHRHVCIWNPVTREYKKVPASPYKRVGSTICCGYDFYYDCKTDDYKLLQIVSPGFIDENKNSLFFIYTLGTNSWKIIRTNISCRIKHQKESGVLVNGALHWTGKKLGREFSSWSIISMDISNEKFKKLQLLPKEYPEGDHLSLSIGVLEDRLCALVADTKVRVVELWVMQDYGVGEFWIKRHVITDEKIASTNWFRLMWSFKNGEMLFTTGNPSLVLYDPEKGTASVPNFRCSLLSDVGQNYYESIVSLQSGTYVGGEEEIKESVETW